MPDIGDRGGWRQQTTLRYHLTPVRMVIIKNLETTDAGEDMEKKEHFYTVGGSVN